jgi:hypothetical protein
MRSACALTREPLQRWATVSCVRIAGSNPRAQFPAQSDEYSHLLLDRDEFLGRQRATRFAGGPTAQPKQSLDLIQGETTLLCMLDKAQSRNISGSIAANSVKRTCGLSQQTAPLVIANRFDVDGCRFRQAADRE